MYRILTLTLAIAVLLFALMGLVSAQDGPIPWTYESICPPAPAEVEADTDQAAEEVLVVDEVLVSVNDNVATISWIAPVDGEYEVSIAQSRCAVFERYWIVRSAPVDCVVDQDCRYTIPNLPNGRFTAYLKPIGDNWDWSAGVMVNIRMEDNPSFNNLLYYEPALVTEVIFDGERTFTWPVSEGAAAYDIYYWDPNEEVFVGSEIEAIDCGDTCVAVVGNIEAMVFADGGYRVGVWAYGPEGAYIPAWHMPAVEE